MKSYTLDCLKVGKTAEVVKLNTKDSIGRRFLDIGIVPGSKIECVMESPGGNPIAYLIKGALIAIRKEDTKQILIKDLEGAI